MSTAREPSSTDDVIDSRDVIATIESLEALLEEYGEDEVDMEYLTALKALAEEGEGFSDWSYGETLIRETYFEDYARELAEEVGAIASEVQWPATCIDWEWAARELSSDYSTVDFDGVTYYIRG